MLGLLLLALAPPCSADSVTLKDGVVVEGSVLSSSGGLMLVQTAGGLKTLDVSEVRFVLFSGSSAPSGPPPLPGPEPPRRPVGWGEGRLFHSLGWRLVTTRTSPGLFFETGYLVPFKDTLEAGPTLGYGIFDAKPGRLSKGKLRLLPFSLMARLKPPKGWPLHFDLGFGYTLVGYSVDSSVIEEKAAQGLAWREELGNSLGGFIGLGVERLLIGNVEAGMTLRWTYLRPLSTVDRTELASGRTFTEDERVNLSGLSFVGNLGIRF